MDDFHLHVRDGAMLNGLAPRRVVCRVCLTLPRVVAVTDGAAPSRLSLGGGPGDYHAKLGPTSDDHRAGGNR